MEKKKSENAELNKGEKKEVPKAKSKAVKEKTVDDKATAKKSTAKKSTTKKTATKKTATKKTATKKTTTTKTAAKKTAAKKTTTTKTAAKKTATKKTTEKKSADSNTTRKKATKTTKKTPTKSKTVRKKSVREIEREQKIQAEKIESREFYRRNRKSDSRRSLKVARAGKRRILRANKRAEMVEALAKMRARNQASNGKYRSARKTSRKAIEKSNRIIEKAVTKNARLYRKFERQRYIKELVEKTSAEINEEYENDKASSNEWDEKHADSKVAKIISGFAKADISVKRFTAKADMGIASLYAKAATSMGFEEHAKMVIEEISMAAEERVRFAKVDNEKARANVDRVFGFAERRRKNLEAAEAFIENLSRDVITGVTEGLNHLNDGLETWIEDIEQRRGMPMPQRNYNLAFAGGGYVSNSFQARSRNVMSLVEGSLTGNQRGGYQTNQRNNTLGIFREDRD